MSIETFEQFVALPVGTTVAVDPPSVTRRQWTKSDEGWSTDGQPYPLGPSYFEGSVTEGWVTVVERLQVGTWLTNSDNSAYFYLYAVDGEEAEAHYFNGEGAYFGTITARFSDNPATPTVPAGPNRSLRNILALTPTPVDNTDQIAALIEQRDRAVRRLNSFADDIRAWCIGDDRDHEEEINEILQQWALDPCPSPMVDVTVEVVVNGRYTLDYAEAERLIDDGRAADVAEDIEIPFTMRFDLTREVEEDDCACDLVSRGDIENYLNNNDINYATFEYETECSNC